MLTSALREQRPPPPLFFFQMWKKLGAIYHSYILHCFLKLKATPSCSLAEGKPDTTLFNFSLRLQRTEASPSLTDLHTQLCIFSFMHLQTDAAAKKKPPDIFHIPAWAPSSLSADAQIRATLMPCGIQPAQCITLFTEAVLAAVVRFYLLFPVPLSSSCCLLCIEYPCPQ